MAEIKLYGKRVLLKCIEVESEGIILSEPDRKTNKGTVVAIGDEAVKNKVGDTVLYDEYGYTRMILHGEEFVITTEEYIIGKI